MSPRVRWQWSHPESCDEGPGMVSTRQCGGGSRTTEGCIGGGERFGSGGTMQDRRDGGYGRLTACGAKFAVPHRVPRILEASRVWNASDGQVPVQPPDMVHCRRADPVCRHAGGADPLRRSPAGAYGNRIARPRHVRTPGCTMGSRDRAWSSGGHRCRRVALKATARVDLSVPRPGERVPRMRMYEATCAVEWSVDPAGRSPAPATVVPAACCGPGSPWKVALIQQVQVLPRCCRPAVLDRVGLGSR